uniref:interleukin-23 subunit alpha-like n=1 Tax=Podarcis muralis TaxID=64176 RepID=UPI00109F8AC3|nr:interleukin-23 subunit alpha-like [Podarcis muralis]
MQSNSNNLRASCLLGFLLLLVAASMGMRLPRENKPSWKDCKDASQEILSELWKLRLEEKVVANTSVSLPQRIECSDKCDPDSLDNNKMVSVFASTRAEPCPWSLSPKERDKRPNLSGIEDVQGNVVGGNMESSSPDLPPILAEWQKEALQDPILLRLQSFAVVVARVISHCAALARNAN